MLMHGSRKNGFTLVEVLVVISIMGVLSTMGVVNLRSAVINSRIKDSALNVTAFLERVANEASRLNKSLCVVKTSDQVLSVFDDASSCEETNHPGTEILNYALEAPVRFGCGDAEGVFDGSSWSDGAVFEPHIGLSAAPAEGFVCVRYGDSEIFGVAQKVKTMNMIVPKWSLGDGSWIKL